LTETLDGDHCASPQLAERSNLTKAVASSSIFPVVGSVICARNRYSKVNINRAPEPPVPVWMDGLGLDV